MAAWRTQFPAGMKLKSEGFASSLYAPGDAYPLRAYCAEHGIPYQDIGLPVPIETFIAYGTEFQRRYVPGLEQRMVSAIERGRGGYQVTLDSGEVVGAARVVVGAGVSPFAYVPPVLADLPAECCTHSSAHSGLDGFAGKDVLVVGAGASALEISGLLHAAGARPHLVARRNRIDFHEPPRARSLWERIRAPRSGLGTGWGSWLSTEAALLFHVMPRDFRIRVARRHLGPAPGWFVREMVEGKVPMTLGATLANARMEGGRVALALNTADGTRTVSGDHVIAATGYRVDLGRLAFLSPEVMAGIRTEGGGPVLSSRFESSLPGLFFVGPVAVNSFGPLMRFQCGCTFAARRVAPRIAAQVKHGRRHIEAVAPVALAAS